MKNRVVDDYLPQVQLKKVFTSGECSFEDTSSISKFSSNFVVAEEYVKNYLEHLKLLELRRNEKKKERMEKSSDETTKKYEEYDWNTMLNL